MDNFDFVSKVTELLFWRNTFGSPCSSTVLKPREECRRHSEETAHAPGARVSEHGD